MRLAGTFSDEPAARRLADYLFAERGIETRVDPDEGEALVWVLDEDSWDEARAEVSRFRAEPEHERYRAAFEEAQRRREADEDRDAAVRASIDRRRARRDRLVERRERRAPWRRPVTLLLIATCVLVGAGLQGEELSTWSQLRSLLSIGTPGGGGWAGLSEVWGGEFWRLVTPILLHSGPLHLFFNMLWLHDFGGDVEGAAGSRRFAVLVLLLAVGSNLAQHAATGPAFGGMSGVVYGLLGFLWMRGRVAPEAGLSVSQGKVVLLMAWFALCWTGQLGPVANVAHASGLLFGVALGYAPVAWERVSSSESWPA